jgi:hypothetical protein
MWIPTRCTFNISVDTYWSSFTFGIFILVALSDYLHRLHMLVYLHRIILWHIHTVDTEGIEFEGYRGSRVVYAILYSVQSKCGRYFWKQQC